MASGAANCLGAPAETIPFEKQTHVYKQAGDCEIKADVYRTDHEGIRPVVVWIHGGALIMGDRQGIRRDQLQAYLKAGYTVVAIDYRLAPETKLKEIIEDLKDAFAWIRREGPKLFQADAGRIGVVGHSAGGYLTLMSGFAVEPRPQALVSFYGYGDIAGAWYSRPDPFYNQRPAVAKERAYRVVGQGVLSEKPPRERGEFYLYCRQNGLWPKEVAGHDPDLEPRAFDPFCPVRNVTSDYPPALLLHGDQDTDVPYEQSVLMAAKLKEHGVQHRLITMAQRGHGFDGGRHGLSDPENARAFEQVLQFLDRHLKSKESPD